VFPRKTKKGKVTPNQTTTDPHHPPKIRNPTKPQHSTTPPNPAPPRPRETPIPKKPWLVWCLVMQRHNNITDKIHRALRSHNFQILVGGRQPLPNGLGCERGTQKEQRNVVVVLSSGSAFPHKKKQKTVAGAPPPPPNYKVTSNKQIFCVQKGGETQRSPRYRGL